MCGRRQDIPLRNEKHDGLHRHRSNTNTNTNSKTNTNMKLNSLYNEKNVMACTVTGQGAGTAAAVSIKVYSQDHEVETPGVVFNSSTLTDSNLICRRGWAPWRWTSRRCRRSWSSKGQGSIRILFLASRNVIWGTGKYNWKIFMGAIDKDRKRIHKNLNVSSSSWNRQCYQWLDKNKFDNLNSNFNWIWLWVEELLK